MHTKYVIISKNATYDTTGEIKKKKKKEEKRKTMIKNKQNETVANYFMHQLK